jgi:hypothetical protein
MRAAAGFDADQLNLPVRREAQQLQSREIGQPAKPISRVQFPPGAPFQLMTYKVAIHSRITTC